MNTNNSLSGSFIEDGDLFIYLEALSNKNEVDTDAWEFKIYDSSSYRRKT